MPLPRSGVQADPIRQFAGGFLGSRRTGLDVRPTGQWLPDAGGGGLHALAAGDSVDDGANPDGVALQCNSPRHFEKSQLKADALVAN